MAEQEACGQAILERESPMETTLGQLLEMRKRLNSALKSKLGREADSYFNIEMNSAYDDRISFCLAYPNFDDPGGAIVNSFETFADPHAAFDFAMQRIGEWNEPTKQDKINEL